MQINVIGHQLIVTPALREYAEDWNERLRLTPNHAPHRSVVALIELSDDVQLRDWLLGGTLSAGDVTGRAIA